MKKNKDSVLVFCISAVLSVLCFLSCQNGKNQSVTPDQLAEKMIHNPDFVKNANGENFCWYARVGLDQYVEKYELTKDSKWLDAGIKYFDFLIGKMETDPDGYKGWIGEYGYDTKYWLDALVGDAILFDGILDFSILVLEDNTLKAKYQDKAYSYAELAKRNFIEKWDKRDCWIEDGPYGTYIEFNKLLKEGNLKNWLPVPQESRAGISHPFNKQLDAGSVCLKLFRITGDKAYRDKAVKIFYTLKSHFQFFDNHYCWNYYEPLYPGDVDLKEKTTRHGVWVHMWRSGYQARDVEKIVEAYNYGIVFDEQDIQRIINTNLNVMWNKDKLHPLFFNSNGLGADGDTTGIAGFQQTYGHSNVIKNGGELWTALLDFDQQIRDLYELRFKNDTTSGEYLAYKKSVQVNPPGFTRKYAKGEVMIPKVNFTESKELNLAVVLPHMITPNNSSVIICQSWVPGDLQIDLYSTDNQKVLTLFRGNISVGQFIMTWDGKDPEKKSTYKGEYKIRWTIGTGYREFPIVIN